jgi:hypothetical protein
MEYKQSLQGRLTGNNCKRNSKVCVKLVRVQVRRYRSGSEPAGEYTFYYENDINELAAGYFIYKRIT